MYLTPIRVASLLCAATLPFSFKAKGRFFHPADLLRNFFKAPFRYKISLLLFVSFFGCQWAWSQQWGTNGTNIYNANTGYVGIGTSTPLFKVDINSPDNDIATGSTRLRFANTTSSGANAPGSYPAIEILGARGDGNKTFGGRLALGTRRTDGVNPLSTQTLGTVLFGGQYGTDATFQAGKIRYPASIQGIAEGNFNSATDMAAGIAFMTGKTGDDVGAGNFSYGTERMRITNTGFVGIGVSNPWSKLQVVGGDFTVIGTDLNGTAMVTSRGGLAYFGNNTYSNGMAVTPSGNVLIGQGTQVNATYKLDVAGNIRSNKIVVNTTGADFVFDGAYSISPLSEVEAYLKRNHHLPGIDPADKMKKDGLDVGENQTRLLQKIEELTLYLIRQDKDLERLKRQGLNRKEENQCLAEQNRKMAEQNQKLEQQDRMMEQQAKELKAQQERITRLEQLIGQKAGK